MLSGNFYGSAGDLKFLRVKFWFREFWGSVESPRDFFCFFFLNTHTHIHTLHTKVLRLEYPSVLAFLWISSYSGT